MYPAGRSQGSRPLALHRGPGTAVGAWPGHATGPGGSSEAGWGGMRPKARWAQKGRPTRLTPAGAGSGLHSVASGDFEEAGPDNASDGYRGRHRQPTAADEPGSPSAADWTGFHPVGGWTGLRPVGGWTGVPPVPGWPGFPPVPGWTGPPSADGQAAPSADGPAAPSADGPGIPPPAGPDAAAVREAVAGERARIARDLHDSVDKSLHGIALAATSLAASVAAPDRPADPAAVQSRLRELASLARYAISETRCVIYDLRDETLSAPLGDVLRNLAVQWSAGSGVPVTLAVPPGTDAASNIRREIIAILREALRNVQAHAHATRVRVSLRQVRDRLLLTVSDNGRGFCLPPGSQGLQAAAHYGLIGMGERARQVGGTLVIRSRPGHGTRIAAQVPAAVAVTPR